MEKNTIAKTAIIEIASQITLIFRFVFFDLIMIF